MTLTTDNLKSLSWPLSRLGEAIGVLAHQSRLIPEAVDFPVPPQQLQQESRSVMRKIAQWVEMVAEGLNVEAEPLIIRYGKVEQIMPNLSAAILRLPGDGEPRFLAFLTSNEQTLTILDPNLTVHDLRLDMVCAALRHDLEVPVVAEINHVLNEANIPPPRQTKARAAILQERLGSKKVSQGWLLRLPSSANFWSQARNAGLLRLLLSFVGVYIPKTIAMLAGWWVLGRGALQGQFDWGWLLAWVLLLFTILPFRLLEPWFSGLFSTVLGWLLKRRLLYGAMQLEPEEIRHQGIGQLFGRTIESEAAERLALDGGVVLLSRTIDLFLTIPILAYGAGGWSHVILLVAWMGIASLMTWHYILKRRRWTEIRLDMSHDLVERMVGHQTRLAQETPERWHNGEDQALENYLKQSKEMDLRASLIKVVVPRGWLTLGLGALAPAFMSGSSTAALAIGLGGTLFIYQSLGALADGLLAVADATIAWQKVTFLFRAATRSKLKGWNTFALANRANSTKAQKQQPILDAHELVYRYHQRGQPVVQRCGLQIYRGDRILLLGPSGGGKSTLASLIIGLRSPESGLLLLDGFDRHTLGAEGWRQRVAAAPQFHENHVFIGTFAFNLLMGRGWPPQKGDFEEAEAICYELGLGQLLERMPAGMLQMVGEIGWQLSHGERSRLYIARTLLQGADLIVLDESFAALDPANLRQALQCTLNRAATLIIIAHP